MRQVVTRQHNKIISDNPRIVSMVPSLTELLYDLDLLANIVGCTKFCVHPKKLLKDIPKFGGTKCADPSVILDLKPTHIIMNIDENRKELFEQFKNKNVEVIVTHPQTPLDNLILFESFGKIFRRMELANNLTTEFKQSLLNLKKDAKFHKPKDVLYLIWRKPWMSVAKDTYISKMLKLINYNTVNSLSRERYPVISEAELLSFGCGAILLSSEPYPFKERHIAEIKTLCKSCDEVSLIDGEKISWYGSRAIKGLEYLRAIASKESVYV